MAATTITVTMPGDAAYLAPVRLMAGGLAAEMGFSVDDIDDLRLAVDEIVAVVIEAAGKDHQIEVRFALDGDALDVVATTEVGIDLAAAIDPLTPQILAAVTDNHRLGVGTAGFTRTRRSA